MQHSHATAKNFDSKSIMLLADGNMVQIPQQPKNGVKSVSKGKGDGVSLKAGQKSSSQLDARNKMGMSIDIDQVQTRNNEATSTKSCINSQRINNLENRLNGFSTSQ